MNMQAPQEVDIAKRVEQRIRLRDKIKEIKDKHKEELAQYEEAAEKLDALLLGYLNTVNTDSAAIRGVGTVYKTVQDSATIADADAFRRHVLGSQDFDLLDWKANKTAVKAFLEENGALPPGVNLNQRATVGVRRA